jgi:OOP family OmpA-OmpF porin
MKSHLLFAVLAGVAGTAMADTPGPYVVAAAGIAFGKVDKGDADAAAARYVGTSNVSSSVGKDPAAFKLQGGYGFGGIFAIEAGYVKTRDYSYDVHTPQVAHASADVDIWNVVGAAKIPVANGFSAITRLGIASVRANGSGAVVALSGRKTGLTGGVGAQYDFDRNLFINTTWDTYATPSGAKLGNIVLWNVGIGYKF